MLERMPLSWTYYKYSIFNLRDKGIVKCILVLLKKADGPKQIQILDSAQAYRKK